MKTNRILTRLRFTLRKVLLVGVALMAIAACGVSTNPADDPSSSTDHLDVAQLELLLRNRVNEKWAAMVANDFRKVYEYTTPVYRATTDYDTFRMRYATKIERTGIEIQSVTFRAEQTQLADVRIKLMFKMYVTTAGIDYDGVSYINETWTRTDGQWWYIEGK